MRSQLIIELLFFYTFTLDDLYLHFTSGRYYSHGLLSPPPSAPSSLLPPGGKIELGISPLPPLDFIYTGRAERFCPRVEFCMPEEFGDAL